MKYRKKPLEVDAIQWTGKNKEEVRQFCGENVRFIHVKKQDEVTRSFESSHIDSDVLTREGWKSLKHGDYIVKGVHGEFYPCKEDVFLETYDKCY